MLFIGALFLITLMVVMDYECKEELNGPEKKMIEIKKNCVMF